MPGVHSPVFYADNPLFVGPLDRQIYATNMLASANMPRLPCPRATPASLVGLLLCLLLVILSSVAAPDLNKMSALALQRYGPQAEQTVAAWHRMIEESRSLPDAEKLARVNTFFNRRVLFKTDLEVYNQEDYWATPLEFMGHGAGDCEDFVISKFMTLKTLGIGNEHLRLIYVRYQVGSTAPIAHMVLGYYPKPTEAPLILDNLISSIRPAAMRP